MNKILCSLLLCSLLISVLLPHCKNKEQGLTEIEVSEIKETYSVEAINYFYETVFYEDGVGPKDSTSKWEKDIWVGMEGTLWPNDSLYVKKAVDELNGLNLPIKLQMTDDESLVNLTVYFGDYSYLTEKTQRNLEFMVGVVGITETTSIQSARVGILNSSTAYHHISPADSASMRQGIILEEITQALGVIGDSWLENHSVFFEGRSKRLHLAEIDKEVMKLLYEPAIPAKLARNKFEDYFQDELYTVNTKEKLLDYVLSNDVPKRYLAFIRDNSFYDSTLFKYPKQIFVKLEGDYQEGDYSFCQNAVNLLNTVSDQFQLEIVEDEIWNRSPSIVIQYNDSLQIQPQAERFMNPGGMLFPRRVKGRIKLSFGKIHAKQPLTDALLFSALYRILGLDHTNEDIVEINDEREVRFLPDYKEILALLYDPVFPSGFTQKELDEVIAALN